MPPYVSLCWENKP